MSTVTRIAFSIEKTTPLQPLTRNEDDRFANVKPRAEVSIVLDPGDDVAEVFKMAHNICMSALVEYHTDLVDILK